MLIRLLVLVSILAASQASAQTGGFVVTLGSDTMQVERFAKKGNRVDGVVATRAPTTLVRRYSLDLNADGTLKRFEISTTKPDGTVSRANGHAGSISRDGDSVTRETLRDGQVVTSRIAAPLGLLPGPSLPYLGVPVLFYELGFALARRDAKPDGESTLPQLTMLAGQARPSSTQLWFIGADSVELDYFGVARRGFKLDGSGRVVRSNWDASTFKYNMVRVADVDVDAIARAWGARDASGKSMGPVSPPDTVRAALGSTQMTVTYSRPSKRGRPIWGSLVPWEKVWRFGADFATHFTTTGNITIGATKIPAGRYTLWMLPSENGESMLIVNTQTNIFGTNYKPANDLARIPLERSRLATPVERFTIEIANDRLWIRWDDSAWSARIATDS